MNWIPPMYARPISEKQKLNSEIFSDGSWVAEEKYDGHRILVQVLEGRKVIARSREGLIRILPPHLEQDLAQLPVGQYDGELRIPGERSYNVVELTKQHLLDYVMFDILEFDGTELIDLMWIDRRTLLEKAIQYTTSGRVQISRVTKISSYTHAMNLARSYWNMDLEGLILKHVGSTYKPTKRPANTWIKIKNIGSAVITITGFKPSTGEIINRGPYARVVGLDAEGNEVIVKTKNDEELAKFEEQAKTMSGEFTLGGEQHPAIGRKLAVEFHERTTDNNYRHARWDHWVEED